jgi:hypothetical protein
LHRRGQTTGPPIFIDPKGPAVGSASFQVEEVVPARIEAEVEIGSGDADASDATALITVVDAQHLTGAGF